MVDTIRVAPLAVIVLLGVITAWGAARLFLVTYRYLRATPLERQRIKLAHRIKRRWKKLAPTLGLAMLNPKGGTEVHVVPKIKIYPMPWGILVHARTLTKVGIDEFQKVTGYLADQWGAQSVEVERVKPGWIEIRALMGNPLDEHRWFQYPAADQWVLPLGHNPWDRDLVIPLKDLSGIKIGGLPGFGKTMLMLGWMASFAGSAKVQFAIFDGKTSDPRYGDWGQVGERAIFVVGDNPEAANQKLTDLVRLIKDRPAALVEERETHKFWKHGPTEVNPLVLVIIDECHNYADSKGLTGKDKQIVEANQRMMQTIAKEGRSVGVIGIFSTQKQTGDAIPTAVRDNLEVGISFATFTIEGAEAALGSSIRKDEANWPTAMVDKERFAGVCVVTGIPGLGGQYDRVRVGDLDDVQLVDAIRSAAWLRRDVIPEPAPTVVDVSAGASVPLQKEAPKTTRRRKAS